MSTVTPVIPAAPSDTSIALRGPAQVVRANFLPVTLERDEVKFVISTVQDLANQPMGYLVSDDVLNYAIIGIKSSVAQANAAGMSSPSASYEAPAVDDGDPGDEHTEPKKAIKAKKAN